jgi:hypothetical protein
MGPTDPSPMGITRRESEVLRLPAQAQEGSGNSEELLSRGLKAGGHQ